MKLRLQTCARRALTGTYALCPWPQLQAGVSDTALLSSTVEGNSTIYYNILTAALSGRLGITHATFHCSLVRACHAALAFRYLGHATLHCPLVCADMQPAPAAYPVAMIAHGYGSSKKVKQGG